MRLFSRAHRNQHKCINYVLSCCCLMLSFFASSSFAQVLNSVSDKPATAAKSSTKVSAAQQIQLEGELEVLHDDDFKNKKSHTRHFLKTNKDERYELKFKAHAPHHPTGTKLRVRGAKVGTNLLALDSGSGSTVQVLAAPSISTLGEQKVAVILVTFSDNTAQPFTPSQVNSVFFGSTNSATSFYKENSSGQTWLSGNILGWYALPIPSTSDPLTVGSYAKQAAKAAGVDLSAFNHYVYVFPRDNNFFWDGLSTVGGTPSETWLNGTINLLPVNHELGHTLGLYHAHYLSCGSVSLASNCAISDYGDPSSNMGNISAVHFDAFQKEQLGWLNSGVMPPIATVTTSGNYTLDPYETAGSRPKALKILKSVDATTGAKTWYYLEYRQPTGFDVVLPTLMNGHSNLSLGVQVRLGTETNFDSSYLLDMTPVSDWDQYDSALVAGQSYTDSVAGIVITTLSADATGATVSVSLSSTPSSSCVRANPSVLMSPAQSASVAPGTTVSYAVAVTNNDSSACGSSAFSLKGSVPSGWSGSLATSALTVSPGSAVSTTFSVTSSTSAVAGSYSVGVTATNGAATTSSASGSATYSVASTTTTTTTTTSKGGGKGRLK